MPSSSKPTFNIPSETLQAARRVYNIHQIYLRIGDKLGNIADGINFDLLDPSSSLNSDATFRLGLASAFQFAESLPDSLASQATQKRMDWKYALYLPIHHPGIAKQTLCAFRQGLFSSSLSQHEFGLLLNALQGFGLFARATNATIDPLVTIRFICRVNHLFGLRQAMKIVLGVLISNEPDWVTTHISPYWYQRYTTGQLQQLFYSSPEAMEEEGIKLGNDIKYLIDAITEKGEERLANRTEFLQIKHLYEQHYSTVGENISWHPPDCRNCTRGFPGNFDP